jgi:hypothetical protein
VLALGAALITPYGFHGLLFPLHLINMSALTYIGEWQSMNFQSQSALPITLWLLIVLFAALTLGWRLSPTRVGMLLLLLIMALKHVRYIELLGLVSSLLLAPSLALQFDRQGTTATKVDRLMTELARPGNWRGLVISGVIMLVVNMIALRGGNLSLLEDKAPAAAVAEVQSQHIKGPVFNAYQFGGYLILSGIAPYIDGRAELYGDEFIKRYVDAFLLNSDVLPQLLNEYRITWTLLPPKNPAAILMDHLPGWQRLYADSAAVVHVRQGSRDFHQ